MKFALTTAVACGLMTSAAFAAETTAPVMDAEGAEVGTVTVQDTESGVALAKLLREEGRAFSYVCDVNGATSYGKWEMAFVRLLESS